MKLEDEELDLSAAPATLDADHAPSPPPTASSSRSNSPTPSEASSHHSSTSPEMQEALVKDLARNLADVQLPDAAVVAAVDKDDAPAPGKKKTRGGKSRNAGISTPDEVDEDELAGVIGMARKSRRAKGKGKGGSGVATPVEPTPAGDDEAEDLDDGLGKAKKSRRAKGKGKGSGTSTPLPVDVDVPVDTPKSSAADAETPPAPTSTSVPVAKKPDDQSDDDTAEMSKKDKRRAKEAAKKLEAAAGFGELVRFFGFLAKVLMLTQSLPQRCNVCSTDFPSRTKLFNHIKDSGHAQAVAAVDPGKGGKKRGKR